MTSHIETTDIHAWFTDNIATYLTGGLDAGEQTKFEAHTAECATCAQSLTAARGDDIDMRNLFADIRPSAGFEDRIIQNLRRAGSRSKFSLPPMPRLSIHPMVIRAASFTAAAVVLAGFGYLGNRAIEYHDATAVQPTAVYYNRALLEALNQPSAGGESGPSSALVVGHASNPSKDGQNILGGSRDAEFRRHRSDSSMFLRQQAAHSVTSANAVASMAGEPGAILSSNSRSFFKPGELAAAMQSSSAGEEEKKSEDISDAKQLAAAAPTPASLPTTAAPLVAPDPNRKIIRHGELSFEVDSFDSAFVQIGKIAAEEGGFIDSTNSEKLDNGKVSGVVTVRLPPEHLDTLILKLRGIGDLKGQKISSDDVTKEYTDLQSELRAATAMEDRLMEIIKTGKGDVKELVLAEREVGVWREKVEKVTGEINYYNNLISLSTLQINLMERDIRQAAMASETETINMGVETTDVEKARADALKAIDEAKGRIIQSDLKQYEAGQMAATIVGQISPDSVGPAIDRLKQLGHVARFDASRHQTTADGAPVPPGVKVHREDTQLQVSLYNLANIAPRQTTNIDLACDDVEAAYRSILSRVVDASGRVVDSSLNRTAPDQVNGTINFETPADKSDGLLNDVRGLGQVMQLSVTENPDVANVTAAKRGFALTLASLANVPPRQTTVISIDVTNPEKDAADLQAIALAAGGRVIELTLSKTDRMQTHVVIDVPLKSSPDLLERARSWGTLESIQQSKNPDAPDADSARARLDLTFSGESELVGQDTGLWASLKTGLGTSIKGLAYSLELIVIGFCLILPWAALLWVGWKLVGRFRRRPAITGAM